MKKRIIIELAVLIALLPLAIYAQAVISPSGSGGAPFIDSGVLVYGSSDATKGIKLEADTNVPTGTSVTLTAPAASGTLVTTAADQTFSGAITFSGSPLFGRMTASGFTPTCSSTNVTSAAITTGSTDLHGSCEMVGNGAGSAGTMTLTFSTGSGGYGSTAPLCTISTGSGLTSVGNWAIHSAVSQASYSTTAPTFQWANNNQASGVVLATNSRYNLMWHCMAR